MKQRKPLLTNRKEYAEVQALMEKIVHLNEKQLHLLTWRIQEFFRERKFVPVLLNMFEQNPPELRDAVRQTIQLFEQAQPIISRIISAPRTKKLK